MDRSIIRHIIWAFEKVRKAEQKKFGKDYRIYYKHSRNLLLKRFKWLNDDQKQQVNVMLYASDNLSRTHWYKGILISFSVPYTNGFTEGCNNKIKVLKRNAYGYKNFNRFRNRILHISIQHLNKQAIDKEPKNKQPSSDDCSYT